MIGFDEQLELFKLIGSKTEKCLECIVVGGSAMLFHNFKSATKDVDLIFYSKPEREIFIKILLNLGFSKKEFSHNPEKNLPVVLKRKDALFDVFSGGIFNFKLSPGIKKRIVEKHEFGNFEVNVVSSEDIILLKSVTDRTGDRVDAKNIIEKINVDWNTIIEESSWQTENGEKAFTVYLFDFMEDLRNDMKADIPKDVIKKVRKISEKEMLRILNKSADPMVKRNK